MLMIILYHISLHATRFQLVNEDSILRFGNDYFCQPVFFRRLFMIEGLMPFGTTANSIFLLISGYFMVERGKGINLGKISKKLVLQVLFAALLLIIVSFSYYRIKVPDESFQINMRTMSDFHAMNWFAGYYFLVVVFAGLFLNEFLMKLDMKKYTCFLLTVFAAFSLTWSGEFLNGFISGLRSLACAIFMYALGGFIKRFNPFGSIRLWALIALIVVLYAFIILSYHNNVGNAVNRYLLETAEADAEKAELFLQPITVYGNYELVPVVLSVVLFEIFRRIRIPANSVINFLGSSTFMIYLFHDNDFWRSIWRESDWIKALSENPTGYLLKLFGWMAFVFATGVLVYALYLGFGRLCSACRGAVIKKDDRIQS